LCTQQGRTDGGDILHYQQQQQQQPLPAYTTPATTAAAAATTATSGTGGAHGRSPQAAAVAADYYSSHDLVQALHERTEPALYAAAVASGTGNSYGYAGGGYAERSSLDIASPPQHSASAAAAASQVRYIDT
jgi:hypothetical protein